MKKSEVIDMLEDVVVLLKGDGGCDDLISAVRYAIAVIQGGTSDKPQECNAINRDKALSLVLDVCNDVMDECETVTGTCGEEVYTDVREVDAILKCNKRIRNGIRQLPSEPVRNSDQLEWIPCIKRLPNLRELVLVTTRALRVEVAYIDTIQEDMSETFWVSPIDDWECALWNITAWMPLPPVYQGE